MNTINKLGENEIFVFGSNLAGKHVGGAALQAKKEFGAEEGVGEGLTGQCYALPTLDKNFQKRNDENLTMSIRKLWKVSRENPHKTFLLTKIGCGIAGYNEAYIKDKFNYKSLPKNIIKPEGW